MADGLSQVVERIQRGNATVGIIGLGYVGLPLAVECARSGFKVLGFDISEPVDVLLKNGSGRRIRR